MLKTIVGDACGTNFTSPTYAGTHNVTKIGSYYYMIRGNVGGTIRLYKTADYITFSEILSISSTSGSDEAAVRNFAGVLYMSCCDISAGNSYLKVLIRTDDTTWITKSSANPLGYTAAVLDIFYLNTVNKYYIMVADITNALVKFYEINALDTPIAGGSLTVNGGVPYGGSGPHFASIYYFYLYAVSGNLTIGRFDGTNYTAIDTVNAAGMTPAGDARKTFLYYDGTSKYTIVGDEIWCYIIEEDDWYKITNVDYVAGQFTTAGILEYVYYYDGSDTHCLKYYNGGLLEFYIHEDVYIYNAHDNFAIIESGGTDYSCTLAEDGSFYNSLNVRSSILADYTGSITLTSNHTAQGIITRGFEGLVVGKNNLLTSNIDASLVGLQDLNRRITKTYSSQARSTILRDIIQSFCYYLAEDYIESTGDSIDATYVDMTIGDIFKELSEAKGFIVSISKGYLLTFSSGEDSGLSYDDTNCVILNRPTLLNVKYNAVKLKGKGGITSTAIATTNTQQTLIWYEDYYPDISDQTDLDNIAAQILTNKTQEIYQYQIQVSNVTSPASVGQYLSFASSFYNISVDDFFIVGVQYDETNKLVVYTIQNAIFYEQKSPTQTNTYALNNIENDYMPIAGGTFTGDIDFSDGKGINATHDVILDAGASHVVLCKVNGTTIHTIDGSAFNAYSDANPGQSINQGTYTTIVFEHENYDYNSEYNTSTGKFTCKIAGVYHFNASITYDWHNPLTAGNTFELLLYKGSTRMATLDRYVVQASIGDCVTLNGSADILLAVNDEVTVRVYQNHDAPGTYLNLQGGYIHFNRFEGHRVR